MSVQFFFLGQLLAKIYLYIFSPGSTAQVFILHFHLILPLPHENKLSVPEAVTL